VLGARRFRPHPLPHDPHVTRSEHRYDADDEALALALTARDSVALEVEVAPGVFEAVDGPFRSYERRVTSERVGDHHEVTETLEFQLAIPVFGWMFVAPVRHSLRPGQSSTKPPWWSPPDRIDRRAGNVLGLLCALSVVAGYLGILLSQTITFAADEFGSTDSQQGLALAATRLGVILSMGMIAIADRKGRRSALVVGLQIGCLLMATTALAPNLAAFATSQTLARGFVSAAFVLLGIFAVEEMPAGSRAYAVSVMSMSGALGGGMVLLLLPLADLGPEAWRAIYLMPLVWFVVVRRLGHHLPESQRYERAELTDADDIESHTPEARSSHRRRLLLLAGSGLLGSLFFAPASQFFNEFLREERSFEAWQITVFQVLTNLPGGIGIVVGGKLADTRGRRLVGSVALVGGVGATVIMYNVTGPSMWVWSIIGALLGAAVIPALSVYGPELFPTNLRGKANSVITLMGVVGSVVGLVVMGVLSDRWGSFGPAVAVLAIGPAILAMLVLLFYPETAHRELEDINPEDAVLRSIPIPDDEERDGYRP
jgi:MFS family permease